MQSLLDEGRVVAAKPVRRAVLTYDVTKESSQLSPSHPSQLHTSIPHHSRQHFKAQARPKSLIGISFKFSYLLSILN